MLFSLISIWVSIAFNLLGPIYSGNVNFRVNKLNLSATNKALDTKFKHGIVNDVEYTQKEIDLINEYKLLRSLHGKTNIGRFRNNHSYSCRSKASKFLSIQV